MPTKTMQLAANDARPVRIEWRGNFKDLRVCVDGKEVMAIANKQELQAGRAETLADGSTLSIGWAGTYSGCFFIDLDGVPLPGSPSDPATLVKTAFQILAFIAIFNLVFGLLAEVAQVRLLVAMGIGWASAGAALLYGALAWGTYRRHVAALLIGALLFAADGLYTLYVSHELTGRIPSGAVFMRVMLMIPLIRALGPIRALSRAEADAPRARIARS